MRASYFIVAGRVASIAVPVFIGPFCARASPPAEASRCEPIAPQFVTSLPVASGVA